MSESQVDLGCSPAEAMEIVAGVAERWGAAWKADGRQSGELTLPARAGLRIGVVEGRLTVEARNGRSMARFDARQERWRIHWQAVVILLFGAVGALAAIAWPFHPSLLKLAPLGIGLAFAAWFLVASRLRSSGTEEFLEALREATERE
jgi:hypothetical protein